MLTLCDRNFLSHRLARDVLATGAHILWRATASFNLTPVEVLPDGTYLAVLNPARTADGPPITVRVIEYTVHTSPADGGTEESSELFCLVTDLLDTETYPALDLADAYANRWSVETVIGHHKTDMGAGKPMLRSRDPEGVAQEMWALFAVYQAIHTLIGAAADTTGIPPEKISFRHALATPRPTRSRRAFPPQDLDLALATFILKIIDPAFHVRERPDRASPRATKKVSRYPARKDRPATVRVTRRIQVHSLRPRSSD